MRAIAEHAEVVAEIDESDVDAVGSLALRTTVRELCAVFQQAENDVRAAFDRIATAEQRLNSIFAMRDDRHEFTIRMTRSHYGFDAEMREECIADMRRQAWRAIVERLEIRRALSIERERQLSTSLDKDDPKPLTEENVVAFVRRFADDLPALFEEAIVEVFNWLRPGEESWRMTKWKTNQKNARIELGPKVILSGVVTLSEFTRRFEVGYYDRPRLLALDNVFSGLDGKGTIAKTYNGPLVDAIHASTTGAAETEYFAVRMYKNGSLHLTFRRLDLLAALNRKAGGANLKPHHDAA